MSNKPKFQRAAALKVAAELCRVLEPVCERLIVAGSLRRLRMEVGDVEILYIPKTEIRPDPQDMFAKCTVNLVDESLYGLIGTGRIGYRMNNLGSAVWGAKNKLAVHLATGIPVDFFEAREANWFNYLVCRTGSAESNMRIATAAQAKGWKWNPYGAGFTDERGDLVRVASEEDAFARVGLPYLEPQRR